MPVPDRFEIEYYDGLEARATDVGEGEYLGVLRATPYEELAGSEDLQILADYRYGRVRAYLIRDQSPDLGGVVAGMIEGPTKNQQVAVIGNMVHFLGVLAQGCEANMPAT